VEQFVTRQQVVTALTLVIVGFWLISAVVRLFIEWPGAAVLDSVMPAVVGYWFASGAAKKAWSSI